MAFQVKDQDLYVDQDLCGSRVPTATEMQVISLVADGMKNQEVANVIGTTDHVVRNMLRTIFDKMASGAGRNCTLVHRSSGLILKG